VYPSVTRVLVGLGGAAAAQPSPTGCNMATKRTYSVAASDGEENNPEIPDEVAAEPVAEPETNDSEAMSYPEYWIG